LAGVKFSGSLNKRGIFKLINKKKNITTKYPKISFMEKYG
jgi:hypothetical protein